MKIRVNIIKATLLTPFKIMKDKSLDKKLQNEFIFGRNLSSSFPSLILVNKKQKVNISIGYSSLEDVISRINKNLKSL